MSELIIRQSEIGNRNLQIVAPRTPITIRPGTLADVPFIDALQKKQSRQVGFFPTKAIEGKVRLGHVLIAEGREFGVGSLE